MFVQGHDARGEIEAWRQDYNLVRPHSSLGNLTPSEFSRTIKTEQTQNPTATKGS